MEMSAREWYEAINDELQAEIVSAGLSQNFSMRSGSFHAFINNLFTWAGTYQGRNFWMDIANGGEEKWLKGALPEHKIDAKAIIESFY